MSRNAIAWMKAEISKVSYNRKRQVELAFNKKNKDAKYVFLICLEIKMWRTDFFGKCGLTGMRNFYMA
jgi:hypothetical protein